MTASSRTVDIPLAVLSLTNCSQILPLDISCPPFSSGRWYLNFHPPQYSSPASVQLSWQGCTLQVPWRKASFRAATGDEVHEVSLPTTRGMFPGSGSGPPSARMTIGRPKKDLEVSLRVEIVEEKTTHLHRCLAMIDNRTVPDVCLAFPPSSRTLWANSQVLAEVSPWWKTTLETSGFLEGTSARSYKPLESSIDDSDGEDEDDDCMAVSRLASPPPSPPLSPQVGPTSPSSRIRTIPITSDTAYHTYRALLAYLYTNQVPFAPLMSFFLPAPSSSLSPSAARTAAKERHSVSLAPYAQLHPSLPRPVSPKSLYRLAHFLEMPSLAQLALDGLKDALTVENVVYELFGLGGTSGDGEEGEEGATPTLGELYDEVWDVEVAWAKEHWDEVKHTKAMQAVTARLKSEGASQHELATLFRLVGLE
ncbi:hypothetical protein JCM8097_007876 [Rhodosporidiobolus ruineniae]